MNASENENPKYMWDDEQYTLCKDGIVSKGIDSDKYHFVLSMLQENLQHARHVENERITYHAFFAALAVGALAFISGTMNNSADNVSLINLCISIFVCFILIILGYITLQLCERWTNAFERHLEYAKGCYYFLHKTLFEHSDSEKKAEIYEKLQETIKIEKYYGEDHGIPESKLKLFCMPLYCFRIRHPVLSSTYEKLFGKNVSRTKVLFRSFDNVTIFILRIALFLLTYKLFHELCQTKSSIIPYLYDGCRDAVYLMISVGCSVASVYIIDRIIFFIKIAIHKGNVKKKTDKWVLITAMSILTLILFIFMEFIIDRANELYKNGLKLNFLNEDNFYPLLLNVSWAIIAAIVCKYIAIKAERFIANIYDDKPNAGDEKK